MCIIILPAVLAPALGGHLGNGACCCVHVFVVHKCLICPGSCCDSSLRFWLYGGLMFSLQILVMYDEVCTFSNVS